MNNNDILNELYNDGENFQPSDKLNPNSVENLLGGIKRKSHKGIVSACITIGIVCLTLSGLLGTVIFNQMSLTLPIKTNSVTGSYDDIYKIVNSVKKANEDSIINEFAENFSFGTNEDITYNITQENSVDSLESNTANTGSDYSETNVQVEGIDEADVVKTDGKYIYSLSDDNKIFITKPNNGNPEHISTIDISDTYIHYSISDIYIYNDKLVAIANDYSSVKYNNSSEEIANEDIVSNCYFSNYSTAVVIYDLSNINSPIQISNLTQSGSCISSRRIDNIVYLTTNYHIYNFDQIEKEKPQTYCPVYSVNGDIKCVDANSISVSEMVNSVEYITIASIDLDTPNNFADICSVLGAGSDIYMSHNNLYTTSSITEENINQTQIMRFSLNGTEITQNGSLTVDGWLLNQFSMDEYNNYFRIVTETSKYTVYKFDVFSNSDSTNTYTTLYVFDNNLNLIGKTENVAKGENVKSVRFDGDTAYFVTFRQTDPLFTVDLSKPSSPQILSELKIPGFSEYLHVFGDDLLLGFGREADPETGWSEGLKLTMFDISDKTNVREIATRIFTTDEAYSTAEYDHKAIFVDEENNIIGIPYTTYDSDMELQQHYSIFKYEKEHQNFRLLKDIVLYDDYIYSVYSRGLYIDNYFYIITQNKVYSFNYENFEQSEILTFNNSNWYNNTRTT